MRDCVVLALSSPVQIGVYEDANLIEVFASEEKSSEALPKLFEVMFEKYTIERLVYANGPGSFMAIKISYLYLKTLSIMKNIPLFATDAFYFNQNKPIKAVAKLYFVKTSDNNIVTQKFEEPQEVNFQLPSVIDFNEFSTNNEPNYVIGAVG